MKKQWYPKENKYYVVEIKVEDLDQLFDKRDPKPYRIKDLDDDVIEYILSNSREIGLKKLGKIRIVVENDFDENFKSRALLGIQDYFTYRQYITGLNIKSILKTGIKSFIVGISFLATTVLIVSSFPKVTQNNFELSFLKEFMILIGWVSMWRPINIFLYEWWPLLELKNIFKKLSTIELEIISVN